MQSWEEGSVLSLQGGHLCQGTLRDLSIYVLGETSVHFIFDILNLCCQRQLQLLSTFGFQTSIENFGVNSLCMNVRLFHQYLRHMMLLQGSNITRIWPD